MDNLRYSADTTFTLQSIQRPLQEWQLSVFTAHQLRPGPFNLKPHSHYPQDWITVVFLCCIIILAWVRVFYYKRLKQIYKAPFSQRFLNILTREGSLLKERIAIALTLVYILTFGFIIYRVFRTISPSGLSQFHEYVIFALCTILVFLFWMVKILFIRLLGIVFKTDSSTFIYIQNVLVFCFITCFQSGFFSR